MSTITIIDYGICNVKSVENACLHLGWDAKLCADKSFIQDASLLILPGVGAFGDGMDSLRKKDLIEPIKKAVKQGVPLLGICLGMQLLFEGSEEFGCFEGLGLLQGSVKAIPQISIEGNHLKLPHIGWNELSPCQDWAQSILRDIPPNEDVYFVHSYTAWPSDNSLRWADTYYGGQQIAAVVGSDNIWGCQFHPERSGPFGLQILRNFLTLSKRML